MLSLGGYVSPLAHFLLSKWAYKSASDIDEHDQLAASQPVIETK